MFVIMVTQNITLFCIGRIDFASKKITATGPELLGAAVRGGGGERQRRSATEQRSSRNSEK